jgi:hypothetical protein
MTPSRLVLTLLGLTVILSVAALVALSARPGPSFDAAGQQSRFLHPRRIQGGPTQRTLIRHTFQTKGGQAQITWFDSDFEPTKPRSQHVVRLLLDGRLATTARKDAVTGTYEDGPGRLTWVGSLARGRHIVEIRLAQRPGEEVGVPYTDPPRVGLDSLKVLVVR